MERNKKLDPTMISVLIPAYNVECYIQRCINSLINQSFTKWRCIIINDGSTDGSELIANEYASKYSNKRIP